MYIYIYEYVYVYVYVYEYGYVYIHICIYIYMNMYMYMYHGFFRLFLSFSYGFNGHKYTQHTAIAESRPFQPSAGARHGSVGGFPVSMDIL